MIAAQLTPVSALKDWVPMQDIRYYLHFDFLSKVYQGHCASLCKVSAQTDKSTSRQGPALWKSEK